MGEGCGGPVNEQKESEEMGGREGATFSTPQIVALLWDGKRRRIECLIDRLQTLETEIVE